MTEREIAAEAEYVMRHMGSEGMGIDTIVGSGKENTFAIITRTTNRRIGTGDHVLITLAPRYEGYHTAIGRVAAVGRVDEGICVERIDNGGSVGFCHLCRRPIRKRISVGPDGHRRPCNYQQLRSSCLPPCPAPGFRPRSA